MSPFASAGTTANGGIGGTWGLHDACVEHLLVIERCARTCEEACSHQHESSLKLHDAGMFGTWVLTMCLGLSFARCDGCKQLVPAEKRMAIWDDPNILVVHLKRFDAAFGKITRDIAFSEHLDADAYMASTSGGAASSAASKAQQQGRQQQQQQRRAMRRPGGSYVLHGVLIHEGLSANSGHYYAYVRDGTSKWHCMNDSSVYRVSEARVHDSQRGAYILVSAAKLAAMKQHNMQSLWCFRSQCPFSATMKA